MGALLSLVIGGAAFGMGVATGLTLAGTGVVACCAVGQCRRGKEREETEPAKKSA